MNGKKVALVIALIIFIDQAIKFYPSYMKWIYQNLSINWSTHTLKLLNQLL